MSKLNINMSHEQLTTTCQYDKPSEAEVGVDLPQFVLRRCGACALAGVCERIDSTNEEDRVIHSVPRKEQTEDNRYAGTELESIATLSDYPVEVDGRTMNVNIRGSGPRKVIILSGRGVTSPAEEYAPLSSRLADSNGVGEDCTVYTIEPFGFGLSDMTEKPRTAEAIVDETLAALDALGVHDYIVVAHSIAGLWALQLANTRPSDVRGFVGIDTAFPRMDDYMTPELLDETSVHAESPSLYSVEDEVADVVGYVYSDAEKERMQVLHDRNCTHDDVFEAMKTSGSREPKAYDTMRFPDNIPTIFALSVESCSVAPWYEGGHVEQITTASGGRVDILEGQHFLHHQQGKRIASMIRSLPIK